jgi:hypothetical protein
MINTGAEVAVTGTNPISDKLFHQGKAFKLGCDIFRLHMSLRQLVKIRYIFSYVIHEPKIAKTLRPICRNESRPGIGLGRHCVLSDFAAFLDTLLHPELDPRSSKSPHERATITTGFIPCSRHRPSQTAARGRPVLVGASRARRDQPRRRGSGRPYSEEFGLPLSH